mmetsp:Transcript_106398/g.185043  ORF Transcript_106398/g.185043 Transcript_106398/m.185043 type:complete len:215 (-) Transcript_106398:69-713(-)
MAKIQLKVVQINGEETALPNLDAQASLKELMQQIEAATGVPWCFQRLLHEHAEVPLSDLNSPLTSLGICDGARLSVLRMSFPSGVFEFKASRSINVNSLFGVDPGDVFDETEHMQAKFNLDGNLAINFKGEYDTGFQIVELKGDLHIRDGSGSEFQSAIHQTKGNWHRYEDVNSPTCNIAVSFYDSGLSVTLKPEAPTVQTPFRNRVWSLQRVF